MLLLSNSVLFFCCLEPNFFNVFKGQNVFSVIVTIYMVRLRSVPDVTISHTGRAADIAVKKLC